MTAKKLKVRDISGNILIAFFRALGLGLANFWRNKFLSAATITLMAVIIFIFNIILTVQFIGNQALQSLNERVDIVIYLRDDISFYEAKMLSDAIGQLEGIKTVKYTSKEEALVTVAKTHPKTAEFLKKFKLQNPLPPSISVVTISPEDQLKVQQLLQNDSYKNLMKNYVTAENSGESMILSTVAKNLASISQFVRQIIFWMVLVFVLGGTLIVINAIQLTIYTRRHEIHIMRLVGATPGFIRLPFIFEAILYSICAVLLSFLILYLLSQTIQLEYYPSLQLEKLFISELIIAIILGIINSFFAVQQYLKDKLTVNL